MLAMLVDYKKALEQFQFLKSLDTAFMTITPEQQIPRPNPANRNQMFALMNPRWCYSHTRFTLLQLWHLYHILEFPAIFIVSDQRHRVSSEAAFIATVVKLATGLTNVELCNLFGGLDNPLLSRMTNHTINWLDEKCQPLLCDNSLARWVRLFPDFAEAIAQKLDSPEYGNLVFRFFRIMGFLDCKIDETCTPGSGPVIDEPRSARHPEFPILQEAFFSGYLKRHGLKVLTVVFPNGIIGYLYGPVSARENDIGLLNLSGLNQNLMALQPVVMLARLAGEHRMYYALFGDSISPI